MSVFDSTSHGKLAQVLLGDLRNLDESLPDSGTGQANLFLVAMFQVVTIAIVAPIILILLPIVALLYRWIFNSLRQPSLGIKRMEAKSHGPVLVAFLDAIHGRDVLVNSYDFRVKFSRLFHHKIATERAMRVSSEAISKWAQALSVQSGCLVYLGVSIASVYSLHKHEITVAKLGLLLTFAGILQRTGMDLMMGWTSFETNLVSMERFARLMRVDTERDENEPSLKDQSLVSPNQSVSVAFHQVTMRYRVTRPLVLKGMTFTLEPGSKVVVVGRTGEGKRFVVFYLRGLSY
jgi:ABC-type multidrug transport system fused ATPase/permease subunit